MTDKEEPQWKRNLNIAVTVVGAVMGIVLLVLSIIAYSQLAGFISDYTSVINSWKAQPVTQMVVSGSSCGEKVQGNWPGIYPACDCSHKNAGSNSTSSDTESCTSQQLSDNCDTLDSTPGIDLNVWGGASGTSLCLTRSDPSALARSTYADGTCGAAEQVCSNETIPFCWPSSSLCPVTDFEFDSVDRTNTTGYNADQMLVAGSGFLYIKRGNILNGTAFPNRAVSPFFQPIGLPITDVTFQPGNVCFLGGCGYSNNDASSANAQYKSNHPGYGYTMRPLDCQGGCKEPDGSSLSPDGYDLRYVKSSYSQTQTQLFTSGNVPVEYQNVGGSNPWYLQYRSEIQWSTGCPETRQRVVDRDTDVKNVRNAQVALLVFGILSFIFLTIYFPCIELCGNDDLKEKAHIPNLVCKICIKLATLVCTIVTVVIAYSTLSFWSSVNDAGGCADALTNETFKTLGDKFGDLSYKNAISTAASSTTSILDGVLFACKRFA